MRGGARVCELEAVAVVQEGAHVGSQGRQYEQSYDHVGDYLAEEPTASQPIQGPAESATICSHDHDKSEHLRHTEHIKVVLRHWRWWMVKC